MKFDFKNPIITSLLSISISFIISLIVLFIYKPSYIMEVKKSGDTNINLSLLVTYSLLFADLIGIITMLFITRNTKVKLGFDETKGFKIFNPISYSPQ